MITTISGGKTRMLAGVVVRGYCEKVYGKEISKRAWANWRTWAKVSKDKRTYTVEQFCFLAAIATIRAREKGLHRELRHSEILAIAEDLEFQETIAAFVNFLDSEFVVGKDAITFMKSHGVDISVRTLYRNIPKFSMSQLYRADYLKEWAAA